jgi:hypothetical protein
MERVKRKLLLFFSNLKDKEKLKKMMVFAFDTLTYVISYAFLAVTFFTIMRFFIELAVQEPVLRYYLCGILFIFAIGLSIANIESYNKKYRKNDSDSSKRQNDYLFEEDIRREEGRYSDRRDVE